jgi:hypothetical protein
MRRFAARVVLVQARTDQQWEPQVKKFNLGIVVAAVAMGAFTLPAFADTTADAVYGELTAVDPAFTAEGLFSAHVDYSDEGGLTYYEVRALVHHLDDVQREALDHACNHVLSGPRRYMEATFDFCKALSDALST